MLTQDNLTELLAALGFTQRRGLWQKQIGEVGLGVDLAKREIIYPESAGLVVNERQTCNLSDNTNGSLDHVGKSGLFDLDGAYCFASYLVRVVPDIGKVLPLFLVRMMNSNAFRQEPIGKAVKSAGQNNINATKKRQIAIPLPALAEQRRFVAEVEALEQAIADAPAVLAAAPTRKQAILRRYL